MPIYEYKCPDCGEVTEIEQSIKVPILAVVRCSNCEGWARKMLSKGGFVLKGGGWPSKALRRGLDEG
jgi:putative FmdB family regulatory protein